MKLIISGRLIELESLGGPLDRAFLNLYSAYFGGQSMNWDAFQKAAEDFFSTLPKKTPKHNHYFNNFTPIWRSHLSSGRLEEAEGIWELALKPAAMWEWVHDSKIHKGTPYYFWGATALLQGDLDKGFALIHQALEEDKRTVGQGFENEPAFALVSLDFAKPDQAFRPWVLEHANFLEGLIKQYALARGRGFSINDFTEHFLIKPPKIDILFLFTYCLARLKHFCDLPCEIVKSDFACLVQINILSDLTLIIEAILKDKNPMKSKPGTKPGGKPQECMFKDQAEYLLKMVSQPLALNEVNSSFNSGFDSTLQSILDGTFRLQNDSALKGHQIDVAVAYGIRNEASHNVFASHVILKSFNDIRDALLNVLFAAIDYV